MRRDTLALFFRRAVIAALPLVSSACASSAGGSDGSTPEPPPAQMCDGGGTVYVPVSTCMTSGGQRIEILDGGLGGEDCSTRCGGDTLLVSCSEELNSACQPIVACTIACIGRAPAGLAPAHAHGNAVGRYLAEAAHLEAASVAAFRRLRDELRALGAPRRLLGACSAAARDEIRHAREAARLARRFGSSPPLVRLRAPRPRSLMALAIENVREGCIGETFGALVATWQANVAADGAIRQHMQSLVADETRHAELAWSIDAWLRRRLAAPQRAHLDAVRSEALARLALALEAPADDELQRAAGVPSPAIGRALHGAFAAEVARRA